MKRIKALRDKFYLDKNFLPLKDKLLNMLDNTPDLANISREQKENILYDVLGAIQPKWNSKKKVYV